MSVYTDLTQVTKASIKATTGRVISALITNASASARFFQLFNQATVPAGGDVPLYSFPIPAGAASSPGTIILDHVFFANELNPALKGSPFVNGIGWAVSTTYGTFTDSATATDHTVTIHYE